MVQNTLGIVLSYYRKKYKFSQTQLCEGICSAATLSRIEVSNNDIDSLMSECLLGRLGKEVTQFEIILNDEDYNLWKMRNEIERYIKKKDYDKADNLLEDYKKNTVSNHHLHTQFYMLNKSKIKIEKGFEKEDICKTLFDSLSLTKPDLNSEEEKLYNMFEIEHILLLLELDYDGWKEKDFEIELLKLFKYVDKTYSGNKREKAGIDIYMQLIRYEERLSDDRKIMKYADEVIDFLSKQRSLNYVAEVHYIKAKAIERYFRNKENWESEKQSCKKECLMAYHIADIMDKEIEKNEIIKFCEEKLEWQITK